VKGLKDAKKLLAALPPGARIGFPRQSDGHDDQPARRRGRHPVVILADGSILRTAEGVPVAVSTTPSDYHTRENEISRIKRALRALPQTEPVREIRPDLKPEPRIKDPVRLKILHARWRECALCGEHRKGLSLHHISKHPRDDHEGNLVMLCGDGVRGCHGGIEAGNRDKLRELGAHILNERDDVLPYLVSRKGSEEAALAWVERVYHYEAA
jgi:hypothetical protein